MVISSSHTALAEKVYHTAVRKARKIRLGGGFSQFFIGNGANCPIKTKIHASLRGSVLVAQRSLTICSVVPKIMSSTSKPLKFSNIILVLTLLSLFNFKSMIPLLCQARKCDFPHISQKHFRRFVLCANSFCLFPLKALW